MKKISLYLLILIATLEISLACSNIDVQINYLDKDEYGCYDALNILIVKEDCLENCFSEFNNFSFFTDTGQRRDYYRENGSTVSNPLYFILSNFSCVEGMPNYFSLHFEGKNKVCNLSFRLEQEYNLLQEKRNCSNKVDYKWNYVSNTCDKVSEDDIIESEKAQENNNEKTGGSPAGGMGGVPSEDEPETEETISRIIASDKNIQIISSTNNQLPEQKTTTSNNNKQETNSIADYLIYIIPILILIVLIQIVVLKLMKQKK